jgi:hypothetical protein
MSSIPFLTQELRVFLGQLDLTRRQIEKRAAGGAGAGSADEPGDPEEIRTSLAGALHQQVDDAKRQEYDSKSPDFQQAQWVSATVADATLDSFDWWGRGATAPLADDFPLPPGVDPGVVAQIEAILAADPPNPELAEIYVLALAAGLPAGDIEPAKLADLRQQLFIQVGRQRPELSQPPPSLLFPAAYARAQSRGPALYLPDLRGWAAALAAVLTGLALASSMVFDWATADAVRALDLLLKLLG